MSNDILTILPAPQTQQAGSTAADAKYSSPGTPGAVPATAAGPTEPGAMVEGLLEQLDTGCARIVYVLMAKHPRMGGRTGTPSADQSRSSRHHKPGSR